MPPADRKTQTRPRRAPRARCAAESAYEWLIRCIRDFESDLDPAHEVAVGFAGSDAGLLKIAGLGFFAPDLITFLGEDEDGAPAQLIQHVSQLNVTLRAVPVANPEAAARRIGFRLSRGLAGPDDTSPRPDDQAAPQPRDRAG